VKELPQIVFHSSSYFFWFLSLTNGTINVTNVTKLSVIVEYIFCQLASEFNGLKNVGRMVPNGWRYEIVGDFGLHSCPPI